MEPFVPLQSKVITPFGLQVKRSTPWYPQEHIADWPHKASALSLGESSVLKYSVTFPLRTGLNTPEEYDFPENVTFATCTEEDALKGQKKFEEIFISRGVCVISEGPIGGPSHLKGTYRPLNSYGSGIGLKSVVKHEFPRDEEEATTNGMYICLVEKGGISLYAEGRCESHVAYMPEFQIDRVISCQYGLLVIPSKKASSGTDDSKYLYMLTHPVKQVSRIWSKSKAPGNDFYEFDSTMDKLLWCEKDLCVFWNLRNNDGFSLKRMVHLEKSDILNSSTLNASIYYSHQEQSTSPFTPAGGSSMCSPLGKLPPKASTMKMNREGATVYYWPTFDFSNTSGQGLSVGFYPPHYCVYDDPEFYFTSLFDIDLSTKGRWVEPQKFQLVANKSQKETVALWFLMKTNLYLHCVNVASGSALTNYAINGVTDFACSSGDHGVHSLVILTSDNELKFGFLDEYFSVVLSVKLVHDIPDHISSIDTFLYNDTLVCSMNNASEKAVITIKNVTNSALISLCIDKLSDVVPSSFLTKLIGLYTIGPPDEYFNDEWHNFVTIAKQLLVSELAENPDTTLGCRIRNTIEDLRETLKANGSSTDYVERLSLLSNYAADSCRDSNFPDQNSDMVPVFQKFLQVLLNPNPRNSPNLSKLPKVTQVLLDQPDSLESIFTLSELTAEGSSFPPVLDLLTADVFERNHHKVKFDWPESVIRNVGRTDYLLRLPSGTATNTVTRNNPFNETDDEENAEWTTHVLTLRIFADDRRLEEACRLLDSASPLTIDIEQRAEMSDHEFQEEQEKHLLQLMQVSLSAPVGRAAFTLRTEVKIFSNLTNVIHVPKLCLSGKCAIRGTNIELNDADSTTSSWPSFHNAVASSIAVRFSDQPADAWFAYNKAKTIEGPEQAGMILGFGLNGILTSMPPTLRHEYLAKENSFTSMAMLLGLSVNLAGTGDIATWKVISLHIGAMLPACTTELEIPRLATLVAPCALGILFMGTRNSHIAKVLLGEISKRYNPLSIFGGSNNNNSATNTNPTEPSGSIADREAHSLCAGFGLGFVNLGKNQAGNGAMDEDGFDGILRRFVVGGPKPQTLNDDDDDLYNQYGQTLPSLWEEYRCCHIEEGDNVNVDVTTPSAIVAVALTYLRGGNEAVLKWLSPPTTLHLLDGVRPDILMLRSLAYILVLEEMSDISVAWLENNLMPSALVKSALKKPKDTSRFDHESINQAWASIVCGYCLGLGIRFAGTSNDDVVKILWHYADLFMSITLPESQITEYFSKNFLESSISTIMMALSLVLAGTGNIPVLRLCRYMQAKIAGNQISASSNTYGLEMCTAMATGILFLGGGRYSLSNDDRSIALILVSVFPKWPINGNDNRYHLQALRHLYVLAAQPRLILPKPMPHGSTLEFCIEYLNGHVVQAKAPVLLPPFHLLKRISLDNPEFLPIEFSLPQDLKYLQSIVEGDGIIRLIKRPVTAVKYNFLKHMGWRETRVFHSTFPDEGDIPLDESYEIKELNLLSRMSESAGLRQIVPALMSFKNGDVNSPDWQLQLRILYWWTSLPKAQREPSSIPVELLGLFLNKAAMDFKLFAKDGS